MVKLKDIAKETGVTIATVSKALKHDPEISAATTEMIVKTARAMGYSYRKPTRKETKIIGVIFPEVRSHYFSELMQSLNYEIERCGYTMITMLTKDFTADVQPSIEKICRFDLDGLMLCCEKGLSEESYQYLVNAEIPTLLLTGVDLPYPMDSIYIKNDVGIRLAMEHLVEQGHRHIGYLGEYMSDVRYHAYCDFIKQNNLPFLPQFVKRGSERFEEGGYQRGLELLKEKQLPTAVVASYDQIAFGAMCAFMEHGLRIPQDISIVGYDNNVMDIYHPVALTSVTNPVEQMGVTAVKILLDAMRHPKTHVVQNVALQSRLVIRSSTCPPLQGK